MVEMIVKILGRCVSESIGPKSHTLNNPHCDMNLHNAKMGKNVSNADYCHNYRRSNVVHLSTVKPHQVYRPAPTKRGVSQFFAFRLHPSYVGRKIYKDVPQRNIRKPKKKSRSNGSELGFTMLGISEFADQMGVCTNTVRNWIAEGKLHEGTHYLHVGRIYRFPWSTEHIEKLMSALTPLRPPSRPAMKSQRPNRGRLKLRA